MRFRRLSYGSTIGVFDSGLGGLTSLKELQTILPGENLVYFGDTGRVPYGSKGQETILRYARQDVAFLRSFDPKAIVVPCGTVSANALTELKAENNLPVFGVVIPAAYRAAESTRNGKVGFMGVDVTLIDSGAACADRCAQKLKGKGLFVYPLSVLSCFSPKNLLQSL